MSSPGKIPSVTLTKPRSINRKATIGKVPAPGNDHEHKLLDPARQKKLQDIRDREMLKGKLDQLKTVLSKKMVFKYGR
jgi:hypothetical protein